MSRPKSNHDRRVAALPRDRAGFASALAIAAILIVGCTNETDEFTGTCLGVPYPGGEGPPCGELFNDDGPTLCNAHDGCEWTDFAGTSNYCRGYLRGCRAQFTADDCSFEPGCTWFAPAQCATWEECVLLWLQSGGCEELAANSPATVGYYEGHDEDSLLIRFADHCP